MYTENVVEIMYPVALMPNYFPRGAVNNDHEYSYGLTKTIAMIMLNTINHKGTLVPIRF
jgi:hypothetical protein